MTGKPPRPPKDWTPNDRTRGSGPSSGTSGGSGTVSTDAAPATVV